MAPAPGLPPTRGLSPRPLLFRLHEILNAERCSEPVRLQTQLLVALLFLPCGIPEGSVPYPNKFGDLRSPTVASAPRTANTLTFDTLIGYMSMHEV